MIFFISMCAHDGRVLGGHRTQDLGSSVAGDTLLTPHTLSCTHISRHTSAVTFSLHINKCCLNCILSTKIFSLLTVQYELLGDDIFTQIQTCTVQLMLMNRCCEKPETILFSSSKNISRHYFNS